MLSPLLESSLAWSLAHSTPIREEGQGGYGGLPGGDKQAQEAAQQVQGGRNEKVQNEAESDTKQNGKLQVKKKVKERENSQGQQGQRQDGRGRRQEQGWQERGG